MKPSPSKLEAYFGMAAHGVRWAFGEIPGARERSGQLWLGARSIDLIHPPRDMGDSFSVAWSSDRITVKAATAVGAIGAFLELASQVKAGNPRDIANILQFRTRNYKHEVRLETPQGSDRAVWKYTDAFLQEFFQQIAARHFNGFVVYSGYHPFESFLDYKGFPHATYHSAELRERNRNGLLRLFTWAKRYGLRTFLHHYATHFTQALADHLNLGISGKGARLAGFEHPVVEHYNRYIYRRTFETMPPLDGLYINFESSGNALPYMKRTLVRVANGLTKKPALFFRLWGVSDVDGMVSLLKSYRGPKALIHKGHDTSDTYFYPVADDRVKVWKQAIPGVEFLFSLGPCHNCGTNISQKLWTDPDYIHALLKNMQDKGADSISFQSSNELLLAVLRDQGLFPKAATEHARMNRGHLEAVVDYVAGRRPDKREWAARYARWYGTGPQGGRAIRNAIIESSQVILKQYRQFCYGSCQEGYLYPHRHSHYQDPFFYYPMSFMNRFGELPHNVMWRTWAVRRTPTKVVPGDTEAIIDSVNPRRRKRPANHPLAIVRQIKQHIRRSRAAVGEYRDLAGRKANEAMIAQVERNCTNGERVWREIMIARELYSCYFALGRKGVFLHLTKARDLMRESAKVLGRDIAAMDRFCRIGAAGPYVPDRDAEALDAIIGFERACFPDEALVAYLRSHERYNEIRRLCRPYVSVREQMAKRNLGLLRTSLRQAEKAMMLLSGKEEYAMYRDNVQAWRDYVRAEIDWLTPPAMRCPADESVAADEGFRCMVHDQDYRWGEECWEDVSSFFRRHDFFGDEHCACRVTHARDGLKVSLREESVDWKRRKALWDAERGGLRQGFFMQVFVDAGNTGLRAVHYQVFFEGKGGQVRRLEELENGHLADGKPSQMTGCKTHFEHSDSSWRCDLIIPWKQLGRKPKKNDIWRLNVVANPAAEGNSFAAWCKGFEQWNDIARLGYIVFE